MTSPGIFFPLASNLSLGESKLNDFVKSCHEQQITDIEQLINRNNHHELLCAVFSDSPYLTHLIFRDVKFAVSLLTDPFNALFDQVMTDLAIRLPPEQNMKQIMIHLRRAKAQVALIISFADLQGQWPLSTITRRLTEFAELTVSLAVSHLLRVEMIKGNLALPPHLSNIDMAELMATPELAQGTGYSILAMGKMGGFELNYSSDIDLIVLYDNDIVHYTGRKTVQDMFIRLTRNLVKIMQERTADGYVFRTDLRLRPDPGATAIALSMEGAEIYYQSVGLNWERAAMIKARPVAGDIAAGYDFLDRIKAFIWRKHLDYVALEDIYAIKKTIHQHHGHGQISFAGQDIKLGHGGIREIEFYAQIFQLISGGREPEIRIPATCDALDSLVEAGKITASDNKILQSAYAYHRRLEHRLQMINDDQTHSMPENTDDLHRITKFMGYENKEDFEQELSQHLNDVHGLFTNLLKDSHQDDEDDDLLAFPADSYNQQTLSRIAAIGYQNPGIIYDTIQGWMRGRYRACRTERARNLLHGLIPEILATFNRIGDGDANFRQFDKFLSRLPSGIQFFSFIKAQPWLLQLLAEIIGIAPNLSEQLAKRPLLLDAVLDNQFFDAIFTDREIRRNLEEQLKLARDFQDILDITRRWASEHKFQVGVQILRNKSDAQVAGRNLSLLADIILDVMYRRVMQEFSKKHGQLPGAEFAIFALGKLGGQELTTTSDLDLVFIYDARDAPSYSDGKKPLSINHYFARLSQQLINALTAMTAEGRLYEIDMRLRPSGNAGPIAVTLDSFRDYQSGKAWTWEHLALTRGRVIKGPENISQSITHITHQALGNAERDQNKLLKDTAVMREKLRQQFGTRDIWSLKHVRGGLVDIEFICQYLILKHGADMPELMVTNTLEQIRLLDQQKILTGQQAAQLYEACQLMGNLQIILRLCLGSGTNMNEGQNLGLADTLCERFEVPTLNRLAKNIIKTQKNVTDIYAEIIELPAGNSIVPPSEKNQK